MAISSRAPRVVHTGSCPCLWFTGQSPTRAMFTYVLSSSAIPKTSGTVGGLVYPDGLSPARTRPAVHKSPNGLKKKGGTGSKCWMPAIRGCGLLKEAWSHLILPIVAYGVDGLDLRNIVIIQMRRNRRVLKAVPAYFGVIGCVAGAKKE